MELENLSVKDLKKLNYEELNDLSKKMKEFMIESTSKTGGHIGANLSSLEISIALHKIFDSPNDKFLFDVGHQAYAHKIITGRANNFKNLNTYKGMARFVERREGEHDVIDVSHAGTSIPIAIGMAKSFYDNKKNSFAIAIIGDGCLVEGMSFEGLNYGVQEDFPLIIVLIDNSFAIAPNVGGILKLTSGNDWQEKSKSYFEGLGYNYFSEPDGHNIKKLSEKLEEVKKIKKPSVFHIKTIKGNGLKIAEKHPYRMHYSSPFNRNTGDGANPSVTGKTYAGEGANEISKLMKDNKNLYVITPATPYSNNLDDIIKDFPQRAFDVGMAEQQAVGMAVGLALEKKNVFVCFQSTFMQRSFDQIYHDACCMNLPITFLVARTGFAGYDSPTHHGLMDLSYLRSIPNLKIYFPGDTKDLRQIIRERATKPDGPMVILHQYEPISEPEKFIKDYNSHGITNYSKGEDGCIVVPGNVLSTAINLKELLKKNIKKDFSIEIIRSIKPMPEKNLKQIIENNQNIITIEQNTLLGGLGSAILEIQNKFNLKTNIFRFGTPDIFVNAGNDKECTLETKIDSKSIFDEIKNKILS
tara:strand:+ start:72 stop:1823 length:1752 start_codon:yes stop_codon:yes gene_type:complete